MENDNYMDAAGTAGGHSFTLGHAFTRGRIPLSAGVFSPKMSSKSLFCNFTYPNTLSWLPMNGLQYKNQKWM